MSGYFNAYSPVDPSGSRIHGAPSMTLICACVVRDSIVIGCDSKRVWTGLQPDDTCEKVFSIKNMAIGVSHRWDIGEFIVQSLRELKDKIPDDIFEAAPKIGDLSMAAFRRRHGESVLFEKSTRDEHFVQLGLYGWGVKGAAVVPAFFSFDSSSGFTPVPFQISESFWIGKAQYKKCLLDYFYNGNATAKETAELVYYVVRQSINYAGKEVGHPICIFELPNGGTLTPVVISNPDTVMADYELRKATRS